MTSIEGSEERQKFSQGYLILWQAQKNQSSAEYIIKNVSLSTRL